MAPPYVPASDTSPRPTTRLHTRRRVQFSITPATHPGLWGPMGTRKGGQQETVEAARHLSEDGGEPCTTPWRQDLGYLLSRRQLCASVGLEDPCWRGPSSESLLSLTSRGGGI
jgi:hypothetical protein